MSMHQTAADASKELDYTVVALGIELIVEVFSVPVIQHCGGSVARLHTAILRRPQSFSRTVRNVPMNAPDASGTRYRMFFEYVTTPKARSEYSSDEIAAAASA